ncbi:hypothetical protein HHI36_016852 [Cryptolaemus montrouzieri]|uniref:Secreted protein n=1 Tax=Cryptolaemus montrouzieri TaxID=559131 RepID=A0ABD2NKZ9_9CUCU
MRLALRTVLATAVFVVAGMVPLDLLVYERQGRHRFGIGQGCFNSYLVRIKKKGKIGCNYCSEEDTPSHSLFRVKRRKYDRHHAGSQRAMGTGEKICRLNYGQENKRLRKLKKIKGWEASEVCENGSRSQSAQTEAGF